MAISAKPLFEGDTKITLIKDYPCTSKSELEAEEGRVIREHKSDCINKRVPTGKPYKTYHCSVCNLNLTARNRKRHESGSLHRRNLSREESPEESSGVSEESSAESSFNESFNESSGSDS